MNDLSKRVEALVFYGTCDESYELFCGTCSLLYQMNGLGDTERAEILFSWAKEQADFSKQGCLDNYGSLDEVDSENGHYGRSYTGCTSMHTQR